MREQYPFKGYPFPINKHMGKTLITIAPLLHMQVMKPHQPTQL